MVEGLLLIDKPKGLTSFSIVSKIRKAAHGVKCGHCGTLDPMAEGLLPILLGRATKLSRYITDGDKSYRASLTFGTKTDTYDSTGKVLETYKTQIYYEEILQVLPRFLGEIEQVPPSFSAIKVDGKPLYARARQGEMITASARKVKIYELSPISFDFDSQTLEFYVRCSKGTYIRSLCVDISAALSVIGMMSGLVRTEAAGYTLDKAIPLDRAVDLIEKGEISREVLPLDKALAKLAAYTPPDFFIRLLKNGCEIDLNKLEGLPDCPCRVYDGGELLGVGDVLLKDRRRLFKIVTHLSQNI